MFTPNLGKPWTTHMGILVKVLQVSEGDVVEFGAGPSSTPLLHWVCKDLNRKLISYENDQEYYNYARQYRSSLHKIYFVTDWNELSTETHRGVLFIDHHPFSRRWEDAIKFKNSVDYLVMHDTESQRNFVKVIPNFKSIYIWKECRPWVSVLSNFKDLSGFEKGI